MRGFCCFMLASKHAFGTMTGTASWGGGSERLNPSTILSIARFALLLISSIEGAVFASQLDGLADGRERIRDSLNFDRISSAVYTCPNSSAEGADDTVWFKFCDVIEEGVNVEE